MNTIWMWFRIEWRTRWRSLLGLLLLIGFATAALEATVAGARRGDTAIDRLLAVTEPATLAVLPNQGVFDWDIVRTMPQVAAVSAFAVSSFGIEGLGDEMLASGEGFSGFPSVDEDVWTTVERPVVLEGRVPDPARADEVAVSSRFVERFGRGVGDSVTLRLFTPDQLDTDDFGPPTGPTIEATVVGVIRSGWFGDEPGNESGGLWPSPGLYAQYPEHIVGTSGRISVNALVRLHDRGTAIEEFEREFSRLTGLQNVETLDLVAAADHARGVTTFEARALMLVAVAALVASVVLLGVAISRYIAASFEYLDVLKAIGMTPEQIRWAAASGPASASVGGVLVGGGLALWVSRWFPVGSAAAFEPSPGPSLDALVLLLPIAVVPVIVVITSMVSAERRRPSASTTSAGSAIESLTASWPLTVGLGARFALSGRSTRNSASGRPALLGAILGVTGVVGALTFAQGISDATDGYGRFGQTYDLTTFIGLGGETFADPATVMSTIAEDRDVDGVLDARLDVALSESGPIALVTYAPVGAGVDVVVTDGRLPATGSELALAPRSAEQAGVEVGDTIELSGPVGSTTLTVTGLAFVPAGPHNSYAEGGWVLPDAFEALFDSFRFRFGLVSTVPDADVGAVIDRLSQSAGIAFGAGPIIAPTERFELVELRTIPLLLAVFVAVLGIAAVAHTLTSTARRRRRDVAMFRALGMRPRDTVGIVFVQAGLIAGVGLAAGLPLGVVLGRAVWRSVALDTPIEFIGPDRWLTLVGVTLAVTILAALLAAWPSKHLASMRLGAELRTE